MLHVKEIITPRQVVATRTLGGEQDKRCDKKVRILTDHKLDRQVRNKDGDCAEVKIDISCHLLLS